MRNKRIMVFCMIFFVGLTFIGCDTGTGGGGGASNEVISINYTSKKVSWITDGGGNITGVDAYYRLSWTPPAGAVEYRLTSKKGTDQNNYDGGTVTSVSVGDDGFRAEAIRLGEKGCSYGTDYICFYTVRALNSNGNTIETGDLKVTYKLTPGITAKNATLDIKWGNNTTTETK